MKEYSIGRTVKASESQGLQEKEKERSFEQYALETWRCLRKMADTRTGFPVDRLVEQGEGRLSLTSRTSVTNIGLSLACTVAAKDLEFITQDEARCSIDKVLTSLRKVQKFRGLCYGWYDTESGEVVTENMREEDKQLISTVDNAWLVAGLMIIQTAAPEFAGRADSLIKQMDFPILYNQIRHQFYGGYNVGANSPPDPVWHYGTLVSEARIATYVGGKFGIPDENYSSLGRFSREDFAKLNTAFSLNRHIFVMNGEGLNETDIIKTPIDMDQRVISSLDGSMFEALMPTIVVPEYERSKKWREILDLNIKEQIAYGRENTDGFWGISPCEDPEYQYKAFGVGKLAMKEDKNGASKIITPHAVFLALPFVPQEAMLNLQRLQKIYSGLHSEEYGFADSVNFETGKVSKARLSLNQAMSFLPVYNYLTGNRMHEYFGSSIEESFDTLLERFDNGHLVDRNGDQQTVFQRTKSAVVPNRRMILKNDVKS